MDITGIEKLGDGVEPGTLEFTELDVFTRAIELQRWRDYYLLCDDKDYDDDKLQHIENIMLDGFYEWLLDFAVRNKSTFIDMSRNDSGKRKSRSRRQKYVAGAALSEAWPTQEQGQ